MLCFRCATASWASPSGSKPERKLGPGKELGSSRCRCDLQPRHHFDDRRLPRLGSARGTNRRTNGRVRYQHVKAHLLLALHRRRTACARDFLVYTELVRIALCRRISLGNPACGAILYGTGPGARRVPGFWRPRSFRIDDDRRMTAWWRLLISGLDLRRVYLHHNKQDQEGDHNEEPAMHRQVARNPVRLVSNPKRLLVLWACGIERSSRLQANGASALSRNSISASRNVTVKRVSRWQRASLGDRRNL